MLDEEIADKVARYMKLDEPYRGETNVIHYLEVLRDKVGFDNVKSAVKNPLKGKKIAAYYGCLLLRPRRLQRQTATQCLKMLLKTEQRWLLQLVRFVCIISTRMQQITMCLLSTSQRCLQRHSV